MIFRKSSSRVKYILGNTIFIIVLCIVTTTIMVIVGNTIYIQRVYLVAQREYDELRTTSPIRIGFKEEIIDDTLFFEPYDYDLDYYGDEAELKRVLPDLDIAPAEYLRAINPDYIGWIFIEHTEIDYPVVRGEDNTHYMETTFMGTRNRAGSIFMDYRNTYGFDSPLTVLYGHNSRSGAMFRGLHSDLETDYIHIVNLDNEMLVYRILDKRLTDVHDVAFELIGAGESAVVDYLIFLDAPPGSTRMLVLSTCTTSRDEDERLIVIAVQI